MNKINITLIGFYLVYILLLVFFYKIYRKPKKVLVFILLWSLLHLTLAKYNFYTVESLKELPRFGLLIALSALIILFGLFSKVGKIFYHKKNVAISPLIHTIRIPIEFILLSLYLKKLLAIELTFKGYNFDILAGIIAVIMLIFFRDSKKYKKIILLWNYFGLFLIFIILLMGITSSEVLYNFFGYTHPNIAVTLVPYILLPSVIVPIVIYNHLTDIKLLKKNNFLSYDKN